MLVAPILTSLAWFHDGAGSLTFPGPVEVPVVLADSDPRPRVGALVDGRRVDTLLAMPGATSELGRLTAVRLGIPTRRRGTRAVLPEVDVGGLVLHDLRVAVVAGEGLTLGLGGLPELAVVLDPSTGTARFVRDGDGADAVGEVGPEGQGPLPVDPADPADVEAVLSHRLAFRPSTGGWAMEPADAVRYLDPRPGQRAALEVRAEGWERPDLGVDPEAVSPLAGDPGVAWRADRFDELARARFGLGALDGAVEAAVAGAGWAGDRCAPWLTLGEGLLRGGAPPEGIEAVKGVPLEAEAVLAHARHLLLAWTEQPPSTRGAGFAVRQPEGCERVHGLHAEALAAAGSEAFDALDHPDALVVRAAVALRQGAPDEAARLLRTSLSLDPSAHPRRDAMLALAEARRGRTLPAAAAVCGLEQVGLVEATWLWEVAARTAVGLDCVDGLPQAVVAWLAGAGGPPERVDLAWALHPGAPGVEAAVALAGALGVEGPDAPPGPSADAALGAVLHAQATTDAEALDTALAQLQARWPGIAVGTGKPGGGAGVPYSTEPALETP